MTDAIGPGSAVLCILGDDRCAIRAGMVCFIAAIEDGADDGQCEYGSLGYHKCPGQAYVFIGHTNEDDGHCPACFVPYSGREEPRRTALSLPTSTPKETVPG